MLLLPSLFTLPTARRGSAALAAVLASVALGACTTATNQSTELDGEEGKVQTVVDDFSTRVGDDDFKGICEKSLSPAAIQAIAKGGDCVAAVKKIVVRTDLTALDVDSVVISGTKAVATVIRLEKTSDQTQIVLEQSAKGQPWQIAAFGNAAGKAVSAANATTPKATTPKATTPKATTPAK